MISRWVSIAPLLLSLAVFAGHATAEERAFPGAVGYGSGAIGWRGGAVIAVTSLADHGPGSLRACAEAEGPRICVFERGGTITLDTALRVQSNVYIAGQTAPGDGVQLRMNGAATGPIIIKNATDVVIRHLKLRPGASAEPSPTVDALTIENAQRIYIGNVSMAFATDETFNIHVSDGASSDITLADSILAYSLDRANHTKGRHSKGALICSMDGEMNACGRISLIGNLFAHHRDRNPDVKASAIGPVEILNNVFFNPISQFGEFYSLSGDADIAYVGNVALRGPSTIDDTPPAIGVFAMHEAYTIRVFADDNLSGVAFGCSGRPGALRDAAARLREWEGGAERLTLEPIPAREALAAVIERSGDRIADMRPADALDARVLRDVQTCGGRVIDRPEEAGGWPILPIAAARAAVPESPWAADPETGLTRIEAWLAALAGDL